MTKVFNFRHWCLLAFLCILPLGAFAQNVGVSGIVKDESSSPMGGVFVLIKGTTTGTTSDAVGAFSLPTAKEGDVLEFSFIGYLSQTLKVGSAKVEVQMHPDNLQIEETVVIAYGTQKKVTVTGSVSNVSNETLMKAPVASLGNALSGNLPGVQTVQYSGMPGGDDPVIRVRGIGSLNSSEPLVLVDGVEREFSQIDPNEVADISILKDASATAVFGVRGANGVILVTTKRGDEGKPMVSFSASAGLQQVTHFIDLTDSYTYANAYNNAQLGDGVSSDNLRFSPEAIQHFKDGDMPTVYPNTNWLDYVMRKAAWQQQYNASVSGGTKTAKYFVSVGMLDQDGLFKTFNTGKNNNFKYRRYNYRANVDLSLSKRSTLSINIGGRVENRTSIGDGEYDLFRYLQEAVPMSGYGIDSEGRHLKADPALVGQYKSDGLDRFYNLGYVLQSKNTLNLDLQYKLDMGFLTPGLSFKVKASYNSEYTQQKNRKNGHGNSTVYMVTLTPDAVDENGNQIPVYIKSGQNDPLPYSESKWGGRNWYAEASFNYNRKFDKHNVGALLLYNQSKTYYPSGNYESIPSGYVGLVARITYDYASKYLVDLNMGYNGSENFAPKKRYGFFPSASIGWIPSEENFWRAAKKVIPYFKIRASWGLVGNDRMGSKRFLYLPGTYTIYNGFADGGGWGSANFGTYNQSWLPGAREETMGNPNVTWETAFKQNYGIDIKFFRNRLSLTADVFFEDRKNILVDNSSILPGISALKSNSVNFGRVKNHGYEITLSWSDNPGDFRYSITPSIAFARNKVIEMAEVRQDYPNLYHTGHPVGQPFGYEFFEFYNPGTTEERYQAKYGVPMPNQNATLKAGDCVYVDLTGDGLIDNNDIHAIGHTDIPEYTGSLNLSFGYKGFDFSMLWVGATNVSRSLYWYYRPQFGDINQSALVQWVYDHSWREDNPDATLPRLTFSNMSQNNRDSSVWLLDASYLRLKNVEIGYTFRLPKLTSNASLKVFASGQNLLTFTNYKANDPESEGQSRGASLNYPMTRIYNFGVKFNF